MNENDLKTLWQETLGASDDNWATLSAGATYKLGDEAIPDTLSGQTLLSATLSGDTLAGTLSDGSTLPSEGVSELSSAVTGIAQYDILSEIGRGGMGVIYCARQGSLRRDVAIKQILPEQASESAKEKFVSEALVTGVLDHPNIVPVHELGQNEDGNVFLSMKLVGGMEWKQLLHPEKPEHEVKAAEYDEQSHIGILLNVCNAISFAHSKGIVHRDLKPENVMVGEFGEVLVMDWGIAVDISEQKTDDTRAQHKSTVKGPSGTPSYMAPELAEGRGADIGPWTDVYLLGAILHEVLTGTPPHLGNNLMAVLLAASKSEPKHYPATIPAGLQAICHKAMACAVQDRYQSVDAFRTALEEYVQHRESMLITEKADTELQVLPTEISQENRNDIYGRYAKVVARYEQALELWSANGSAEVGASKAREAYARLALAGGDFGLAEAQAAPLSNDSLKTDIKNAQEARRKAAAAAKRMKLGLLAAVLLIIIGLGVGITLVLGEQAKTEEQKQKAEINEEKARAGLTIALMEDGLVAADHGDSQSALEDLWEATQQAPDVFHNTGYQDPWVRWQLVQHAGVAAVANWQVPRPTTLIEQEDRVYHSASVLGPHQQMLSVWKTESRLVLIIWDTKSGKIIREKYLDGYLSCSGIIWTEEGMALQEKNTLIGLNSHTLETLWVRSLSEAQHMQAWGAHACAITSTKGQMYGVDLSTGKLFSEAREWIDSPNYNETVWMRWAPNAGWRMERAVRDPDGIDKGVSQEKDFATGYRRCVVHLRGGETFISSDESELFEEVEPSGDGRWIIVKAEQETGCRLLRYRIHGNGSPQIIADDFDRAWSIQDVSYDGRCTLVADESGKVRLYASSQGPRIEHRAWPQGWENSCVLGLVDAGAHIIRMTGNGTLQKISADNWSELWSVPCAAAQETCLGITSNEQAIVFYNDEKKELSLVSTTDGSAIMTTTCPLTTVKESYDGYNTNAPSIKDVYYSQEVGVALVYTMGGYPWGWYDVATGKWDAATNYTFDDTKIYSRAVLQRATLPESSVEQQGYTNVRFQAYGKHVFIFEEGENAAGWGGGVAYTNRGYVIDAATRTLLPIGNAFGIASGQIHGDTIAVNSPAGIGIWDMAQRQQTGRLPYESRSMTPIAIDTTGHLLFVHNATDQNMEAWDIGSARRLAQWTVPAFNTLTQEQAGKPKLLKEEVGSPILTDDLRLLRTYTNDGLIDMHLLTSERPTLVDMPPVVSGTLDSSLASLAHTEAGTYSDTLRGLVFDASKRFEKTHDAITERRSITHALLRYPEHLRQEMLQTQWLSEFMKKTRPQPAEAAPRGLAFDGTLEKDAQGWTFRRHNNAALWRYVPAGSYSILLHTKKHEVVLSNGFWISDKRIESLNSIHSSIKPSWKAAGIEEVPAGFAVIDAQGAQHLTDVALPFRLPSVAEQAVAISLYHNDAKAYDILVADGWKVNVHQEAKDPWGIWQRSELIEDGNAVLFDGFATDDGSYLPHIFVKRKNGSYALRETSNHQAHRFFLVAPDKAQ